MDISIPQEKFHQIVLKRYRVSKLNSNQVIRRLLCYYQELACASFPTEDKMTMILGELYDAKFHVSVTHHGDYSLLIYTLTAVDPCYIDDEGYTLEVLEKYFDEFMIPKMNQKKANQSLFERAVEIYKSDLLDLTENLQASTYQNALSTFFAGTSRQYLSYGTIEDLEKITPKDLYDDYEQTIKEETISLCTGHVESKEDLSKITLSPKRDYFFKERNCKESYIHIPSASSQCYLYIIYDLKIFSNDPLFAAAMCFSHIFGGSSSSYLFEIVREKYGLCYSVHTSYLGGSGILVLSCVLDPHQLEAGKKAILEAIDLFSQQKFDLDGAKEYFLSNIDLGKDYIGTAMELYVSDHYFLDTPTMEEEKAAIKKVTKEDIMKIHRLMQASFTYVYGGSNEK